MDETAWKVHNSANRRRLSADDLTTDELIDALRVHAGGWHAKKAAVDLLAAVHRFTSTKIFNERAVLDSIAVVHQGAQLLPGMSHAAHIDYAELFERMSAYNTDEYHPQWHVETRVWQICCIACHLCTSKDDCFRPPIPVSLSDCLSGLDIQHTGIVLNAIAHHQGVHEYRYRPDSPPTRLYVTGKLDFDPDEVM